ncbi:hypothetical protein [Streptacidiphilus sp. EB129]|uniref:SCO2583/SCO2584 N-terminal domain-containing protein n=1 Tax=Streptacidiphilus sp. EB129 TaxID=3156262 RepID=UPI003518C2DE
MPTLDDPQPPPSEGSDPFEGLVLDEDFVRGATKQEGSARARGLAAKWKHSPPADTSWRAEPTAPKRRWYRRAPKPSLVGSRKPRGRWQAPVIALLAAALVLVGLNAGAVHDWLSKHLSGKAPDYAAGQAQATPSLQAPETAPPTAAPTVVADPAVPTVAHPFVGSPAANWPEGASAIVVPTAHAVGTYSSTSVASYLNLTKQFLVDSNLDPALLAGAAPTAAMGLIDPLEQKLLSSLRTELAHPNAKDGDGTELFTRFNPDQAVLDGTVVKVQGEMTFTSDGKNGLAIHADYSFVYPLRPGPHPDVAAPLSTVAPASWLQDGNGNDTDVARSIIRRVLDVDIPDGVQYQHTPHTLWISQMNQDLANSACGVSNGFINPQFPLAAPQGTGGEPSASGPAVDPYDRSKPPTAQQPGTCGQLSRT